MNPTDDNVKWMTERANALVGEGWEIDEALVQAAKEGEERARARRWQPLEPKPGTRLRVSLGDLLRARRP